MSMANLCFWSPTSSAKQQSNKTTKQQNNKTTMKNVPGQVVVVVGVVFVAFPIARSPDQRQQRCHDVKISPCQMVQNLMKSCQWTPMDTNGYQWVPREKEQDERLASMHTQRTSLLYLRGFYGRRLFFSKTPGMLTTVWSGRPSDTPLFLVVVLRCCFSCCLSCCLSWHHCPSPSPVWPRPFFSPLAGHWRHGHEAPTLPLTFAQKQQSRVYIIYHNEHEFRFSKKRLSVMEQLYNVTACFKHNFFHIKPTVLTSIFHGTDYIGQGAQ